MKPSTISRPRYYNYIGGPETKTYNVVHKRVGQHTVQLIIAYPIAFQSLNKLAKN